MSDDLNTFTKSDSNWRDSLRTNNHKTYVVIALFFSIYLGLGLLIDTFWIATHEPPSVPLSDIFNSIITLQVFPLATTLMLIIAAISLWVTFSFSDQLMLLGTEYREVKEGQANTLEEQQLYNAVEEMKIAAGLTFLPKIYIIQADYMNAFASGYSEKSAMIAITAGLLQKLNRDELQAVIAHELSHIRHMDIKLTLMASVLANIMVMVLDIFFYQALFSNRRSDDRRNGLFTIIIILRYLLPTINILLLLYLSRRREFMADAGSVELMRDNQPLARALLKISGDHADHSDQYADAYSQTSHENVRREAYIFDPVQAGIEPMHSLADTFSTHPCLRDRLKAIGYQMPDN